jgi:hypothetical protein
MHTRCNPQVSEFSEGSHQHFMSESKEISGPFPSTGQFQASLHTVLPENAKDKDQVCNQLDS